MITCYLSPFTRTWKNLLILLKKSFKRNFGKQVPPPPTRWFPYRGNCQLAYQLVLREGTLKPQNLVKGDFLCFRKVIPIWVFKRTNKKHFWNVKGVFFVAVFQETTEMSEMFSVFFTLPNLWGNGHGTGGFCGAVCWKSLWRWRMMSWQILGNVVPYTAQSPFRFGGCFFM